MGHMLFLECYKSQNWAHNDPMCYTEEGGLQKLPLKRGVRDQEISSGKGLKDLPVTHLKQGDQVRSREGQHTAQYHTQDMADPGLKDQSLRSEVKGEGSPRA